MLNTLSQALVAILFSVDRFSTVTCVYISVEKVTVGCFLIETFIYFFHFPLHSGCTDSYYILPQYVSPNENNKTEY